MLQKTAGFMLCSRPEHKMSSPSAQCQFASTAGTVTKSRASLHRRPGFVVFLLTLNPVPVTLWYRICKSWRAPFSVPGAAGNELRQALQRHRISGQLLVPFPHFPPLIAIRGCLESDRNPAPGRPGRQLARGGSSDAESSQGPGSLAKGPEDFPRLEAKLHEKPLCRLGTLRLAWEHA